MPDAILEVVEEVGTTRTVHITETPFRIGRSGGGKNHLALEDGRISRQSAGLPVNSVEASKTAIDHALAEHRGFIEQDVDLADESVRQAESIVNQQLRSVIAIPLYSMARVHSLDSTSLSSGGNLLGVLYLDSRRPAAFSGLDKQILDALAIEAASVIDNARMVEIERERRQMEQDLSIARDIQQRLLPKEIKQYPFFEVTGINDSCYSVGGDYYDLVDLGPERTAFVIADVAGKGLAAALLTAMIQGGFAGMSLTQDPTRLITHFNRYIWARSEPNRYATVFMGLLDEQGRFDFINAGHHSALLVRDGDVDEPFQPDSFPVGMFPAAEFATRTSQLEPGDTLVMFTDGINEAVDAKGEEFGTERLREVVLSNAGSSVQEIQQSILKAVSEFVHGADQADDMTLLILRYTGTVN